MEGGCTMNENLIVALDVDEAATLDLADSLSGVIRWVKVGMTLFYAHGPSIVSRLRDAGFAVFLDLKLHDIPHQVEGAARSVAGLGAGMLTVHASGGGEMIAAAVRGARAGAAAVGLEPPTILAVTVLTSMDDAGLRHIGVSMPSSEQVPLLGGIAMDAGAGGVVCSPLEAADMRRLLGPDALVVTPGVRPAWAARGDQSRILTPAEALAAGASHLVVGRPVTGAAEPLAAARRIIAEIEKGTV